MTHQTLSMCWPKGILSGKTNTGDLAFPHRTIFSLHCPLVHQLVSHCTWFCIPPSMILNSQALLMRKFCLLSKLQSYCIARLIFHLPPALAKTILLWHNINMGQSSGVSCGCKFNFFRSCSKTFFRVIHFGCLNLPSSTISTLIHSNTVCNLYY